MDAVLAPLLDSHHHKKEHNERKDPMARMGMDVDAVENVSRRLHSQSEQLRSLMNQIGQSVEQATQVWDGNDSKQFHGEWTGHHRQAIERAIHDIEQLGQKALRNAQRQRETSQNYN